MPAAQVNPTRMELTNLKRRLAVAVRGHKLLKDKRDEMVRQFILLIRRNKEIRERLELELNAALKEFAVARAIMPANELEEAIFYPSRKIAIEVGTQNVMSVVVPTIKIAEDSTGDSSELPYAFATTSAQLDGAIETISGVLPLMLELAQIEKTCDRLADEIEKTRRRVNALEYVMIPEMHETIRYIAMKLDENERGSLTRLMKVKDMMVKAQAEAI